MSYPILLALADTDETYPGLLYLSGEGVRVGNAECCYCANPMIVRGTRHLNDDTLVPQTPETGDHDGIVSGVYAPVAEVSRMESDYSHLRCVLDGIENGVTVSLTVAELDPYTVELGPDGKHARYAA